MAVGCSHGDMISSEAEANVHRFVEAWKPKERIHLGDFVDLTALRGGAKGSKDETVEISKDLEQGIRFLKAYRPTKLCMGNHDVRAWEMSTHHNAIIAEACTNIVSKIQATVKSIRCEFNEEYDIESKRFRLGDTDFLHGFMYSETAIRDHAEHFGKCVFAHLHKVGMSAGRRSDNPVAYCVGLLGDIGRMKYANRRRATSQWSNGFAFGEYCEDQTVVMLTAPSRDGSWRLPV
jgi:hypothetical protein